MADIFSELKAIIRECDNSPNVPQWVSNELSGINKGYGWHPVSEPPQESGSYFVTLADETGDYVAMANYDPRHYNGDHWQIDGVVAWMPMPEMYKPEAQS